MKKIISISISILFFLFAQYAFSFEASDIVVKVQNETQKQQVLEFLKHKTIQAKVEGEKFLLISRHQNTQKISDLAWNEIQDQIKSLHPKISIMTERRLVPQNDFITPKISCEGEASTPKLENKIGEILGKLNSEEECTLSKKCKGQSLSWGPLSIGADFAEKIVDEELAKTKNQNSLSRVAVVDTGFNMENQKSGLMISVETKKGSDTAGDINTDEGGHGTPVSGMIAGRNTGVTKNTDLSVYKITREYYEGVESSVLAAAIEKACKDNNDIVNLSWGSSKDEQEEIDAKKELWYEVAERLGCLVVKSAGNGGVREKKGTPKTELSDPLLLVEALDSFDELASFSSTGMVASPGAGVYSLLSQDHLYGDKIDGKSCEINGNTYGPINGTSFSSPAVAGVAAQIVTVLKAKGVMPGDPKLKVKLIKSILIASQQFPEKRNGINAYGALLIAQNISKNKQNSTVEELVEIGRASALPICEKESKVCKNVETCQERVACVENLREKTFLCKATPKQKEELILALNELDERKLVMSWMGKLSKKELSENPVYLKIYNQEFFEKVFSEAGEEEKIYLLTTSTFQKRPEWEKWVRSAISENYTNDVIKLLMSPEVQKLPEWGQWVDNFILKNPKRSSVGIILKNEGVQKLPEWESWVGNYLDQKSYSLQKDEFLSHPTIQRSSSWKKWANEFLQSSEEEYAKLSFLSSPHVLKNENWNELATMFWNRTRLSDSHKIDFLKDPEIQKKAEWGRFATELLVSETEVPRLSYLLRDEQIQKLPVWKDVTQKFLKNSKDATNKALLLANEDVAKMPEFDQWVNQFIANHRNDDSGMRIFLLQEKIKKRPEWGQWAMGYIETTKDDYSKFELFRDPQIQSLPEFNHCLKAEFDKPKLGYYHSAFLQKSESQNLPVWEELANEYMQRGDPSYLASFLTNARVKTLPGWDKGVHRFVDESNESFAIYQFLTNQDILERSDWSSLSRKFLTDTRKNQDGVELLTFPAAMKKKEWGELAGAYIEETSDEKKISYFLKNEYVQNSPEWPKLAKKFLEKSKDEQVKESFLNEPSVQKRLNKS